MGILFAFLALLSWGFGDFLIERATRKFGDWVALFYIEAVGTIALLPFVWRELPALFMDARGLTLLLAASAVILFAGLLDFEALRVGKISVVEPIYALEIPVTAMLSSYFLGEHLRALEIALIGAVLLGIFLVATRSFHHFKNVHVERGAWLAVFATLAMGGVNFLFGVGARAISPLMINWFTSAFILLVSFFYLASQSRLHEIRADWRRNKKLVLGVSVIDNAAWVAFAYSTLFIPIAITTSISES